MAITQKILSYLVDNYWYGENDFDIYNSVDELLDDEILTVEDLENL